MPCPFCITGPICGRRRLVGRCHFFAAGFAHVLWRREWAGLVLACWCASYFLTIGGLHTKHVRYLLPMLPGLSLLAAVLGVELYRR